MALQLAGVPQILALLGLSQEQQQAVMTYATTQKDPQGRALFAGAAAVAYSQTPEGQQALGGKIITAPMIQAGLAQQNLQKLAAASADIRTIAQSGTQEAPAWLKANWGNNGVNAAIANPTPVDATASLVNMAQNMVMLANSKPEIAASLKQPVEAASILAGAITGNLTHTLDPKERNAMLQSVVDGLYKAAKAAGGTLLDAKGQPIDPQNNSAQEFVTARMDEVISVMQAQIQAQATVRGRQGGGGRSR